MNLGNPAKLLLRGKMRQQCDEWMGESFTSSSAFHDRLCGSSAYGAKKQPLRLEFPQGWKDSSCNVMAWYNRLIPSTQLTAIEHHQTLKMPFFHEFLLIHLVNGSVCRLERMGDGLQADALRVAGCKAYDIIQWFPAEEYASTTLGQKPSKRIMLFQPPPGHPFDLLDILAICYSIRRHSRASIYTLQRYNCYFLCNTVLGILARRVAQWKNPPVTPETWPKLVEGILEKLTREEPNDAIHYFGIGVCLLLEPDHPNTVDHVLNLLRSELLSFAREELGNLGQDTLWHADSKATLRKQVAILVNSVAENALVGETPAAQALRGILNKKHNLLYPKAELDNPQIQKLLINHYCIVLKHLRREYVFPSVDWAEEQLEQNMYIKPTDSRPSTVIVHCVVPQLFVNICSCISRLKEIPGVSSKTAMTLKLKVIRRLLALEVESATRGLHELIHEIMEPPHTGLVLLPENLAEFFPIFPLFAPIFSNFFAPLAAIASALAGQPAKVPISIHEEPIHEELLSLYQLRQSPVIDTPGEVIGLLQCYLGKELWAHSLSSHFVQKLDEITFTEIPDIAILGTEPSSSIQAIYAHIQQRIMNHAERVDSHGLAPSFLVEASIKRAMIEVWQSLPKGFGGV